MFFHSGKVFVPRTYSDRVLTTNSAKWLIRLWIFIFVLMFFHLGAALFIIPLTIENFQKYWSITLAGLVTLMILWVINILIYRSLKQNFFILPLDLKGKRSIEEVESMEEKDLRALLIKNGEKGVEKLLENSSGFHVDGATKRGV